MRISDWSSDVCSSDLKRAKYQEESTKVSMVSVSRSAAAPHFGQAVCFQVGWCARGLPGRSKPTSSGRATGNSATGRSEERRVGKECVVRVDLGGRRIIKKKHKKTTNKSHENNK